MTSIKLIVNGATARAEVDGLLTSGMVGIPVTIEYDSAWDGLTKNLVCKAGGIRSDGAGVVKAILNVGSEATVAPEVMIAKKFLYLGVEGRNAQGTLVIPTILALCGRIQPSADVDDDPSTDPTLPVWAQLEQRIDNLEQNGGGGGSDSSQNGADGATFTPDVSSDGVLSWTNDKGLTNPTSVNIMGPQGEQGIQGDKGDKGDPGARGEAGPAGADGEAATFEITGVTELAYGAAPTVTEAAGSTAQARKYTIGIPAGKPGASTGGDVVPSYWQTALDTGAESINTALCNAGRNKSAFLFYSDVHWNYGSQMSPTLLKYLYNHTGMNKTFFGGDIVNDEATDYDTMEYLWEWRRQLKGLPNHHSVPGNHDDGNSTNNLFSEQYVYGYLLAAEETPDIVHGDSGLYYYIDNPAEKTRYLCLDTGYKDISSLSTNQAAFIKDSLKSTPEGWHIVVISHIWYVPDYDQYDVRPIPITGLSATAAAVAAILDNYNARSGEFAGCGATVAFCIGGHVHRDYTGTTDGGIPIIVVETDSQHIRSDLTYSAGTVNEASVNGIVADYDDDILTVVRVGRGNSFTVDLSSGESTETPGDGEDTGENTPAYTNVLDAVGYQTGYRLNSSGVATARSDRSITGFIKAKPGDTLYFKNITTLTSDYGCNIAHYTSNSEDAFISGKSYVIDTSHTVATWDNNGNLASYKVGETGTEWVRFCFVAVDDTSIITVNEPIE